MTESATPTSPLTNLVGKTAVIDGDTIVYRCAFSAEKTFYLVTGLCTPDDIAYFEVYETAKEAKAACPKEGFIWTRKEIQPLEFALQATKTTMEHILSRTGCQGYKLWLSGRKNFREDVAKTKPYKGNRDAQAKPKYWREVREYLISNWGAQVTDGIEADDAVGIAASQLADAGFIVTNDKDLDQIAGWHYDWTIDRVYNVSRKQASFALYSQVLSGDSTDNVPGLEGVGEVKAQRLLDGASNTKDLCIRAWNAYRDYCGGDERKAWEYFLEQARLVYIQRKAGDTVSDHLSPISKELSV